MMGILLNNTKRIALFSFFILVANYCSAINYTWVKNGAPGNWSTAANWSPVGVPSNLDNVTFNATGTANCDIDIPVITILQFNIAAGYTGTINNNGTSLTVAGYFQDGGVFNGNTGSITGFGAWSITNGTFNSTSGTLTVNTGPFTVAPSATFNANGGTCVFFDDPLDAIQFDINGDITFCNLTYSAVLGQTPSFFDFNTNGTLDVLCCFANDGGSRIKYTGGTINIRGCLCTRHSGGSIANIGTTQFIVNGTGTQTIYGFTQAVGGTCTPGSGCAEPGNFTRGRIPNLTIQKAPNDTLLIEGTFSTTGTYTYVSGIIKTKTNGVFAMCGGTGAYASVNGPAHSIANFAVCGGTIMFNTTITADSAAIWANINPVVNATVTPAIIATREVVVASLGIGGGGNAVLRVQGTGTQTMYCNALLGEGTLPQVVLASTNNLVITRTSYPGFCPAKPLGANYLSNAQSWTYLSGNISGDGIVCFNSSNGTNTITNAHTLPNISYHAPSLSTGSIKSPTALLTARDTLFTDGTGRLIINGLTDVTGSVFAMNTGVGAGAGGSGTITIRGTVPNASFSSNYGTVPQQNGANGFLPNIVIDKPSGTLTLYDTISVAGNWTLLNGNVVANTGSNIFLHGNGFNLDHENGTGAMSFYDLTLVGAVTRNMTGSAGVNNRFLLSAGRLNLNTHAFTMNSSAPANLVRTTGFVVSENPPAAGYGRFEWAIGSAAAGNSFVYPFGGVAGTYIPFTFQVQAPGSTGGKLAVATYPTDWTLTPNNNPLPTGVTNIDNILGASNFAREVDRFWVPEATGFATNPIGNLTFTYRDEEWNLPQNNIVESRLEGHRWLPGSTAWELPNGTSTRNNPANTVTYPNQNIFTPFTVVDPELPDLRISASDTIVCLGNAVSFFDENVPTPNSSQWSFPGGVPATSSATNPTNILYSTTGCKTVILEATYAGGTLRDTFPCYINVVDAAVVAVNDSDITCNGLTDGRVWLTVSGGTPPYGYLWSAGAGTQSNTPDSVRNNLPAGPYSITVTDTAGCSAIVSGTITEPTALTSTETLVDPLCNGVNNGSATFNVSGGTPFATGAPYTYTWNPNVSTSNGATGLGAGTYTVTVTDANGCTLLDTASLVNPAALTLTMDSVPESCFGVCDGEASVTVSGGTPIYTYAWSNGGTTATITGLCAATYTVTVTDGNGCTGVNSVQVTSPAAIVATVTPTDATCFGATDGSATSSVTPGGATYSWQPATAATVLGTNANVTGLAAGNYKLVVSAGGCNDTTAFTIGQPTEIITTITGVNIGCNGAATGSATVSYTGGPAGGATYAWQRNFVGIAPTTATITGLTEGTYSVVVTVAGVCTGFDTIILTENPVLTTTTTQQDITCFNGADGEATVTASGGTGNYSYAWTKLPSTPIVPGNTATISGLDFGVYEVVVTDDSSCVTRDTVTLTNPAALGLVLDKDDAECFGTATGRAWATVTGGTTPYTYAWSRGTNTPPSDDTTRALLPGFVTVTVTDANGCFFVDSINIGQSSAITTSTTQTNVGCFGGNNGSATVTASGGPVGPTPTYVWLRNGNPVPGGNAPTINNLVADTFTVIVTIGNCQAFDTVIITSPAEIVTTITGNGVACFGGNTGSATVTYTGGPVGGADSYLWLLDGNPFANNTSATINNLVAGEYTVTVTVDTCLAFDTILIVEPTQLTNTTSQQDITCFNGTDGEATATPAGGTGPYTYSWTLQPAGTVVGNTATVTGLGAGVYEVEITDDSSCTLLDTVTLANPTALGIQMGADSVSCFGACDGSAWVIAFGGTSPYNYLWSNSGTTDTITGLCAGMYYVTVTDANGCDNNDSIFIGEPTQIVTSIAPTNVTCFGGNDGEATITVSGGPTGFAPTFAWLQNGAPIPGGNAATVTGLAADTFTVTINIGGCLAFDTIIITEPTEIITTITGNNVACFGGNTGSATVTYTGGPIGGTDTYLWLLDGNTFANNNTATITNLVAGEYTVTVTIDGICEAFDTITIIEPTQLTNTASQQDISCFNGTDGEVTATPAGGTGPYTYDWTLQPAGTSVGNTATVTGLGAGVYQVEITDDSSCTLLDTVTLLNPAALGLQMGADSVSCFGLCDGTAWVVASGGTTPYTYSWNNGAITDTITGLCAGWYFVTVTDAGGCANNDSVFVGEPTQITTSIAATNVTCFGGNDGEATITVTGGPSSATPTFAWLRNGAPIPGGNGATVTGLVADTFTVTVNVGGCLAFDTIIITEPAEIVTTVTGTNVTCFGAADGTAEVTHIGGPSPATTTTYTWLVDGATFANNNTAAITNLVAGEYTVTVDIDGCLGFDTILIIEPTPLTSTITGTDPDCNGGTVGSTVTVTPTGGTPFSGLNAYNFDWTLDGTPIGGNDATVSGFGAGQYIVTITDSNSCTINDTVVLNNPPAIVITKDSLNVKCFGDANGKAWVTISGGTPGTITPYTIAWGGGGVVVAPGDTIDNLLAGTYTVTVTDGRGCTAIDSFIISQPPALGVTLATDSISCFGGSDGRAWATAVGGVGGFVYQWSPPGNPTNLTGDTIDGLSNLTYSITVTDDSLCTAVNSVTVPQPSEIILTHDSLNVLCFGDSTGKAWVTATGGSPGYTYLWSDGTPTNAVGDTIGILAEGTYFVTVTDGNGCTAFDTVFITQPASALTLVMDSTNVSCFGLTDGKAWVTATGGTPIFGSYDYAWNNGTPIGQQDTIINLDTGTYIVTVSDSNSCVAIDTVTITEPPLLTLTKDSINVLCFADSTGKAWVTVAGGTPGYNNVVWTGPGTPSGPLNDTLNNLAAGTYTASVTDTNGCVATATFIIEQPTPLVLNMFAEDVNCFGDSTGKAWVVVTGGTPGTSPTYTYQWSGGTQAGAGDTIRILVAGTYTVTVTDANGCIDTNSITILQPIAPLAITMDSSDIGCFGETTGKAWATVTGGTVTYTYTWPTGTTPSGPDGDTIIGLAAGVYPVTVTDALGCTIEDSISVTEPPLLEATITGSNITCFGDSTGRAFVTPTGGTGPYSFNWSGGNAVSNGDTIIGLGAGQYIVTVTDASLCEAFDTIVITEPAELVIVMDSINVSCNGANDGIAWVIATGGTSPYTYAWSNGASTDTITGLAPGIYVVTVTDDFNCTKIGAVTIDEPNLLLGNIQHVNVRCFGENSGRAWATAVGGTAPYSFTWSGGTPTNATQDTIVDLVAGTYFLTITDNNLCEYFDTVIVTEPSQLLTTMDSVDVLCFGDSTGRAWVTATGGLIGAGYNYTWSGGTPIGDGDTIRTLRAGSYFVTVTDDTGCVALDTILINQPPTPITLVKDSVNILCFGDSTGRAWVTASGGTLASGSNYSYTWSRGTPLGIGDTVGNLSVGVIRVTVTDDNGCEATTSFTITQPNQLLSAMSQQNVLCFGESTGKAWVTVTGGAGGYVYDWNGAGTPTGNGDTTTNLVAGTYFVDITDANGCTISDSVTITEPLAPLATTLDTAGVLCFGGNSGRAWVDVTGGTPNYTYVWSAGVPFGAGDSTLNLTAGPVSVTVTDANGCTISDTITVTEPATALSIVMDSTDVNCFSACDGQAWVTATGGTAGYTYQWANTTVTLDTLSALCPGNYVVTVTDANGCRAIDLVSVNEPDELLLTTVVDSSAFCNGNGRGQVTLSLTGGTGPYDYRWSNGDSTIASVAVSNTVTNLNAGQYTVTVTDANGCISTSTIEVFERSNPQVVNIDITATLCSEPNGAIILAVNTTDQPLTYEWSHSNDTGPIVSNLESATYTVTITAASTCDTVIDIFVPAINPPVVDSVVVKDSYCGNEDGVASVQVSSGTPPYVFAWSHDTSLVTNTATGLVEGTYTVTVTDDNGCDTTLNVDIVEIEAPELSVTPNVPQTIYSGQGVDIEVSLVGPIDSVYYEWLDFPGLDCYDCTNPIATPDRSTTYQVRVTDDFTGCTDTAYVTIVVRDETNIFIPNAITPNGDGSNDTWVIRELATFPDNEVIVLNRWGDVVFSASPYQNDFDGTRNGTPLPAGTYYYIIKLDNISESVTGPITIIK